jgi:hypothetical protein
MARGPFRIVGRVVTGFGAAVGRTVTGLGRLLTGRGRR